ncbi:unnamed protein product, partial [Prorocentrum cordatum]
AFVLQLESAQMHFVLRNLQPRQIAVATGVQAAMQRAMWEMADRALAAYPAVSCTVPPRVL